MSASVKPPGMDRRPLKTREKSWAKRLASAVAQAGVSPNTISVLGMIAGLLGGGVLAMTAVVAPETARWWWLGGAVLVQLRLLANMLDGMVAIESGRTSLVGELYNEVPDRISDMATLIGLGYAAGAHPPLGLFVAGLAVLVAYVRAMGKAAGAENDFCGPMAKPQRMFFVTVVALYGGLTPTDWPTSVLGLGVPGWALVFVGVGCVVTIVRRLAHISATLKSGGIDV